MISEGKSMTPKIVKNTKKSKFVVISYSHADQEIVYRELNYFVDKKINIWYDANNHIGDNWFENIRDHLEENNCVGIIIFVSKNSLCSININRELEFIKTIKEIKKFYISFVYIDYKNTGKELTLYSIKSQAQAMLADKDEKSAEEVDRNIQNNYRIISEFGDGQDRLYGRTCSKNECPFYDENATECECKKRNHYACKYKNDIVVKLTELKAIDTYIVDGDENERELENQKALITDTYRTLKGNKINIKWYLLYKKDCDSIFICSTSLELCEEKNIENRLKEIKNRLGIFKRKDEWELGSYNSFRLLTLDEFSKFKRIIKRIELNSEKASMLSYWWIENDEKYNFILPDGYMAENRLYNDESFGLRPVIVLKSVGKE